MKRILTAAVLVPPVVWLVYWAHALVFAGAVACVAMFCFYEYLRLARDCGVRAAGPFGFAAGLVVLLAPRAEALVFTLVALTAFTLSVRPGEVGRVLSRASALTFGILYVFGTWRCAIGLREANPHWLLYALALNWLSDMAAYYIGRLAGRHKLCPEISPGKTWEGSLGSVAASVLFGILFLGRFLPSVPVAEVVALSIAANVAGQLGDLCESALKRCVGVKDSGSLLPGHGGWLDRVDSSLFTMPAVYFWISRPWQV